MWGEDNEDVRDQFAALDYNVFNPWILLARSHVESLLYRSTGFVVCLIGACVSGLELACEVTDSDVPAEGLVDLVGVNAIVILFLHTVFMRLLAVSPHYKVFIKMADGSTFTVFLLFLMIADSEWIWERTYYLLGFMTAAWIWMGYKYHQMRAMGNEWRNLMPWNLNALEERQVRNPPAEPAIVNLNMVEDAPPQYNNTAPITQHAEVAPPQYSNTDPTTQNTDEAPPGYDASVGTRPAPPPVPTENWGMPPAYQPSAPEAPPTYQQTSRQGAQDSQNHNTK